MRTIRALALVALMSAGLAPPAQAASAAEPTETFVLFVGLDGDGDGSVTSSPDGIDCHGEAAECEAEYAEGTEVTLTAAAGPLSTFVGWDGACSGTGTCAVTMSDDLDVWATFDAHVLDVSIDGDGAGGVSSTPAGIECDEESPDCSAAYAPGTEVSLTATPGEHAVFVGWGGSCTGTGTCVVTVEADVEVSAEFDTAWLTVDPAGDGTGVVTSDPAGVDCTSEESFCQVPYLPGTEVTLTATPSQVSLFTGWGGACSSDPGDPTCLLTMEEDEVVSATFDSATLSVARRGDGPGTVTASPGGLVCPPDCFQRYLPGTAITLEAAADPVSVFVGWGGACTGTETCALPMDDDTVVTATFDTGRVTARTTGGDGIGVVTSAPSGIDCPVDCRENFLPGSQVTLTATPDASAVFTGWSGACTGTGTCVVDAGGDPTVTAAFDSASLTVDRDGDGAGVVTSEPAGINCGEDCLERYLPGSVVSLTPTAQAGSTFAGWAGDCTGLGECVVTLDQDRAVTATFNPPGVGGKIAYECSGDICVMNEDGTEQVNLTQTPGDQEYAPTLSSDGLRVAFMSDAPLDHNPDGNIEIAAMNVDGTGVVQVTDSAGSQRHNYDPDWSPDGTKIVFASTRDSSPVWQQIFVINADGSGETMVTDPADGGEMFNPQWSPDGTKIGFTWWLGQQDVYVMNADGTGATNLTPRTRDSDERSSAWSPDGTRIAFSSDRYYDPMTFNTDIMVVDADGTDVVRVTDHLAIDESPTWSPDGLWIAFSSARGGSYDIWAVEAPPPAGHASGVVEKGLRQLTSKPGAELEPYWAGTGSGTPTYVLKVKRIGTGKGVVQSAPAGIKCGRDCSEVYVAGSRVVLTAKPSLGSVLTSWSVPCQVSPTSGCHITVDAVKEIKVTFTRVAGMTSRLERMR